MILARGSRVPDGQKAGAASDDSALQPTKGGSYIIGRKYSGAWEPGSPIDRPDSSVATAHYYMPPDGTGGTVLRVSYRCGWLGA